MAKTETRPVPSEERKFARMVKARERGYYGQLREPGDVFENTLDLPTFPDDQTSWLEDAKGTAGE